MSEKLPAATSESSEPYCEKADDHGGSRCVWRCDRCLQADFDEGLDADQWRKNMERECKP